MKRKYFVIKDNKNIKEVEIVSRLDRKKQAQEVKETLQRRNPFFDYKILQEVKK